MPVFLSARIAGLGSILASACLGVLVALLLMALGGEPLDGVKLIPAVLGVSFAIAVFAAMKGASRPPSNRPEGEPGTVVG